MIIEISSHREAELRSAIERHSQLLRTPSNQVDKQWMNEFSETQNTIATIIGIEYVPPEPRSTPIGERTGLTVPCNLGLHYKYWGI